MSEGLDQTFVEKMAIPEGGAHEEMDVSYHSDDGPGYVSIKLKGLGRPIEIRTIIAEKLKNLSPNIEANTSRPAVSDGEIENQLLQAQTDDNLDKRSDEFLDKKTRDGVTFDSVQPETESSLDLENHEHKEAEKSLESISTKLQENDKKNAQQASGFKSQSEVVSLASILNHGQAERLEKPSRGKYKLCKEKQTVGMRKTKKGKDGTSLQLCRRQEPYPMWMTMTLKEIQGRYVEFEGKQHQVQVSLVPIENESQSCLQTEDREMSDLDPTVPGNIHAEGSIDRPPDDSLSLESDHDQTSAVYPVARTQSSTNNQYKDSNVLHYPCHHTPVAGVVTDPNIYAHDQPLDLTIAQPLDLSMKEKSTEHNIGDNSLPVEGNEEMNSVEPSGAENTSMNMQAETNITEYRIRCPSVASLWDRESELGDVTDDTDFISDQSQNYLEQDSISEGNLPSLGKLTLECNSKLQNVAVQDSSVKQEIENSVARQRATSSGQQNILDLIASGQVSVTQLLQLYCQNQLQKSSNDPVHTSHIASMRNTANLTQHQQLQPHVVTPQVNDAEGEQDIPAPAIPNLHSLELANTEGGIFETEKEIVRNNLKKKLQQKKNE